MGEGWGRCHRKGWEGATGDGKRVLADDAADGLQRGEVLALAQVQGLVGVEVLGRQHLSAGGAHPAVQLGQHGRVAVGGRWRLPGVALALVLLTYASSCGLLLQSPGVPVRG